MEIAGVYYGRCDASDWKEAETLAAELLEYMNFINIHALSPQDAIFPFDYVATLWDKKCVIDVRLKKEIKNYGT